MDSGYDADVSPISNGDVSLMSCVDTWKDLAQTQEVAANEGEVMAMMAGMNISSDATFASIQSMSRTQ